MQDDARRVLSGPIFPSLVKLAGPMLVGMTAIGLLGVVDAYFVARLGTTSLVALSFVVSVTMCLANLVIGFGVGVTSVLSRSVGAQQHSLVARRTVDAALFALALTALLALVSRLAVVPFVARFGASSEVQDAVADYMEVWSFALLPIVIVYVGTAALRGAGETRSSGMLLLGSSVLNLLFDPLFIFGLGPISGRGLRGAAMATLASFAVVSVFTVRQLVRQGMLAAPLPSSAQRRESARAVLPLAVPGMVSYGLVPAGILVTTALVAPYGETAVAAMGVAGRLQNVCLIVPLALSGGLAPFVGINWGAHRLERVARGVLLTVCMAGGCGLVCWGLLALGSGRLTHHFSDDAAVQEVLTLALQLLPATYAPIGIVTVIGAMFIGIGQAWRTAVLTFLRCVGLAIPLGWVGSQLAGIPGIFGALTLSNLLTAALAALWTRRALASRPVMSEPEGAMSEAST